MSVHQDENNVRLSCFVLWYRVTVSHSVGPQIQPPTSGYICMKLCNIKGPFSLSESKSENGVASRLVLRKSIMLFTSSWGKDQGNSSFLLYSMWVCHCGRGSERSSTGLGFLQLNHLKSSWSSVRWNINSFHFSIWIARTHIHTYTHTYTIPTVYDRSHEISEARVRVVREQYTLVLHCCVLVHHSVQTWHFEQRSVPDRRLPRGINVHEQHVTVTGNLQCTKIDAFTL